MVLCDFQVFADEPGFLHSTHFLIRVSPNVPNPLISCLYLFKHHLGMESDPFFFHLVKYTLQKKITNTNYFVIFFLVLLIEVIYLFY